MKQLALFVLFQAFFAVTQAQTTDTTAPVKKSTAISRGDSLYMVKLNTSGNLMIAGGIGLTGVGSYLIYQGYKVYTTKPVPNSSTYNSDLERNHKQGTIYLAAGGVAIVGGIVLTALGARNKVEFKNRKRKLQLDTGMLQSGQLGLALGF